MCREGTVMVADTRILREYEATNETKFHKVFQNRVVVAGAGATASMDYFADELRKLDNFTGSQDQIIQKVEDAMVVVKQRYLPRMGSDVEIDAIIGGLDAFDKGEPYLKVISSNGVSEKIKRYRVIGHGAPYAATLFGLMYTPELTLRELAVLGYFVISTIVKLGLDQTVGVDEAGPEVIIIKKDEMPSQIDTAHEDFRKAKECVKSLDFRNLLVKGIWVNEPKAYSKIEK